MTQNFQPSTLPLPMIHFIPPSQRRIAMLAAQSDSAPVLVGGASGSGKGAICRWLHANSSRVTKPYLESTRNTSLAQQLPLAQGGTFVVHEIGEWPRAEQMVLLKYFKNRSVQDPLTRTHQILNVRVIATTSQVLDGRAQGGLFNTELLEILSAYRIEMPPLEERKEEFEDIVLEILSEMAREAHREYIQGLSQDAWEKLRNHDWPGNLRELRNVLKAAVLNAKGDDIRGADLPDLDHDKINFKATREQFEKIYIVELLKKHQWDVALTCEQTKMDRETILQKMQRYGITLPPENS